MSRSRLLLTARKYYDSELIIDGAAQREQNSDIEAMTIHHS